MAAEAEAAILFWVGSSEMAAGSKSGINWGRSDCWKILQNFL